MAQRYKEIASLGCPLLRFLLSLQKKQAMSDGNFNRALLPSTPFASGVVMGKKQMAAHATDVFKAFLKEKFPALTDEERKDLADDFSKRLK